MKGIRKQRPTFYVVAVLATVLLSACGKAVQPNPEGLSAAAPGSDGPAAADFEILVYQGGGTLGGLQVNFADVLRQGKPVVLNLWAGLCPPCRLEMPDFEEVNRALGDEIILLGLDVGPFTNLGTSEDGMDLLQTLGVTYPAGTTADADVVREYELIGMPTTYFITPDGEIIRQWTGLLTEDKLTELVEELIRVSERS
jgi:thiol-disulfide isomerase/thioredoxin